MAEISADQHLDSISMDYLGFIPQDDKVIKAIRRQKAVLEAFPASEASRSFITLAKTVLRSHAGEEFHGGIRFFGNRLLKH